jgi:hypothetical protein
LILKHIIYYQLQKKNPYNVYVLQASAAHGSQFKIRNNCAIYNIGNLEVYNLNFNESKQDTKEKAKKDTKEKAKKDTKEKYSKRCPNGMRRNKLTNNCESKNNVTLKANKAKLPRCPNKTRRNKITKICEPFIK